MSYWVLECRGKAAPPAKGEAEPMYAVPPPRRFVHGRKHAERFKSFDEADQAAKKYKLTQFIPVEVIE